jgi:threonine dehydrogenase-like Zn-dependent dehydrogenase
MIFKKAILTLAVVGCGAIGLAGNALAVTYSFVGSWTPYDDRAPIWNEHGEMGPTAYTAQEAAALIFGGTPSSYAISTMGRSAAAIDHKAWYDVIGVGGNIFADNYFNKYLGQFYGPATNFDCCGPDFANSNAASAFVRDNEVFGTNYAFKVSAVPLPAALPLLITAIAAGFGVTFRRNPQNA